MSDFYRPMFEALRELLQERHTEGPIPDWRVRDDFIAEAFMRSLGTRPPRSDFFTADLLAQGNPAWPPVPIGFSIRHEDHEGTDAVFARHSVATWTAPHAYWVLFCPVAG